MSDGYKDSFSYYDEDAYTFESPSSVTVNESIDQITITADRIIANELSAISANLGNVTAGNISGVNIVGTTITGGVVDGAKVTTDGYFELNPFSGYGTTHKGQFWYNALTKTLNLWARKIADNSVESCSLDVSGILTSGGATKALEFQTNSASNATAILGWNGTQARMRVGGTGTDMENGFAIHKFDTQIWRVSGSGVMTCGNINTVDTYNTTNASAANVFVSSGGLLYRGGVSSIKYKKDVEDLSETIYSNVLDLRPVWYRSKCEADRPDWSFIGLIAEEVKEIEPRLVNYLESYDSEGNPIPSEELEPETVDYSKIGVMLIPIVKKQKQEIEDLKSIIANLTARVEKLEGTV